MVTLLGARNATGPQIRLGTLRTKSGTSCELSRGQRRIQMPLKPHKSGITKSTKRVELQNTWSGRKQTGQSAMPLSQEGGPRNYAQHQYGQINTQSQGFTPKQCASRKKPEFESTSTISCRCKARSFAACTLNRICKYSMGQKMRANAISYGRTCRSRIEAAYAQPRLFSEPKQEKRPEQIGFEL